MPSSFSSDIFAMFIAGATLWLTSAVSLLLLRRYRKERASGLVGHALQEQVELANQIEFHQRGRQDQDKIAA